MAPSERPDLSQDQQALSEADRIKLVHNEQTKLRATLFNTVAAGFVIAGIVTPIAVALRSGSETTGIAILSTVVWFLLAAGLHYAATVALEGLR